MSVTVSISQSNEQLKCIEENCEGTLTSLVGALKKIQSSVNEYLTELVEREKNAKTGATGSTGKDADPEECDDEIEEDFIDSEIKKKLSMYPSSVSTPTNEKRSRNSNKQNKRARQ
ncbi:UNVERIFIED_CONTAM: hypothetical protein PYX00_007566 [Menopon gallinae]|uniref:Uncharacterized protein n=1 Tax=Menopon gallinae TaxID=328185 RepID=A0AAW2HK90_9NEOP